MESDVREVAKNKGTEIKKKRVGEKNEEVREDVNEGR